MCRRWNSTLPTIKIPHQHIPAPGVIHAFGPYRPWKYHLWRYGRDVAYPDHSKRMLDLKDGRDIGINYCLTILAENIKANHGLAIAAIPSSDSTKLRSGVQQLVSRFAPTINALDVADLLVRHTTIEKLAGGGNRSMETHLDSLKANGVNRVVGRTVILVDDIITTGNSLAAGRKVLVDAGVPDVICIAMGQTIND